MARRDGLPRTVLPHARNTRESYTASTTGDGHTDLEISPHLRTSAEETQQLSTSGQRSRPSRELANEVRFILCFVVRGESVAAILRRLLNESSLTWHPVNLTDLFSLCRRRQPVVNGIEEERYLTSLVERFDQMKSFYSPEQRLSIRRNVISVFQQCQQQNASLIVLSLLLQLAEHAFRQPEGASFVRFGCER